MQLQFKWSNRNGLIDYEKSSHEKPKLSQVKKLIKAGKIKDGNKTLFLISDDLIEVSLLIGNNIKHNKYSDFWEIVK